jgi:hypothetical protein
MVSVTPPEWAPESGCRAVALVRDSCRWEHAGQPFFSGDVACPPVVREVHCVIRGFALPSCTSEACGVEGCIAGKAVSYTQSLSQKLTMLLTYAELELSTSLAGNSMRPIAGRRDWPIPLALLKCLITYILYTERLTNTAVHFCRMANLQSSLFRKLPVSRLL